MTKQEERRDDERGLVDLLALYHKQLLEKNPVAISAALIVSILHLRSVELSSLVASIIVCYVISFYVVPALCNTDWSKTTSSDVNKELRDVMISRITVDARNPFNNGIHKNSSHGFGLHPYNPANPINLTNPQNPISLFYQSSSNNRKH